MTELLNLPAQRFVGLAHTESDADQMGTFAGAWADFRGAGYFTELDKLADVPNQAYMVIFSPYGRIQYWIGSVLPAGDAVPAGLASFALPAATAGQVQEATTSTLLDFPVQVSYGKGLEQLEAAGFPLPNHIGQSDNPYYIERYNQVAGNVTEVVRTLYINLDQLEGYDEFD